MKRMITTAFFKVFIELPVNKPISQEKPQVADTLDPEALALMSSRMIGQDILTFQGAF